MRATFQVDASGLQRMIKAKIERTGRAARVVVNQTALNVVHRTLGGNLRGPSSLTPQDPYSKRQEIGRYMSEPIATRIRLNTSGKRKGKFRQRGRKQDQLIRANLIIQARRKREGLKGLYGSAMRAASAGLRRHATLSVGFAKSIWIPIVRALNPLCRFKVPFSATSNIARWPGSAGYGVATVSGGGTLSPLVKLRVGASLKKPGRQLLAIEERALGSALRAEEREMRRHLEEELKKAV